jgi:hypothetical protein
MTAGVQTLIDGGTKMEQETIKQLCECGHEYEQHDHIIGCRVKECECYQDCKWLK